MISTLMVIGLADPNPNNITWDICIPFAFFVGFFAARLIMTIEASKLSLNEFSNGKKLKSIFLFWTFEIILHNDPKQNINNVGFLE